MVGSKKLIVRLKGGLGNQLFSYAAAKRLAAVNSAELIIDPISGFENDTVYERTYQLYHFNINTKFATPLQRMEPFKRKRKDLLIAVGKKQSFKHRKYIFQEQTAFDERLLELRFKNTRFIDGYWQSEKYFKDIEPLIRKELTLKKKLDSVNNEVLTKILAQESVALHFRWFDDPGVNKHNNIGKKYYLRAIEKVKSKIQTPHFFVFSDNTKAVLDILPLKKEEFTIVNHNTSQDSAHKDLWLMSKCKSIIMANSSFSWWAAWLGEVNSKFVICPESKIDHEGRITSWNFEGQLPERWIKI